MKHKNLWMCWFQGLGHKRMPKINRKCLQRWKELNEPEWRVTVITRKNIADHAPEFEEVVADRRMSLAKRSDVLRLILLKKYGGVWADASVFPTLPLSGFIDSLVNETNFFAYRFPKRRRSSRGDREVSSWFLAADQIGHPVIQKWGDRFFTAIRNEQHQKYFCMHDTLAKLMDEDQEVRDFICGMTQIDPAIPHSACPRRKTLPSFVYKRPEFCRVVPASELTTPPH
jgi:mannosyltransferase OCH1-like enzyme